MATFYVLPSRLQLGQRYSEFLTSLFPGSGSSSWNMPGLADELAALLESSGNAYVVYREDLDESVSVKDGLLKQFGAELDDEIVEIHFGPGLNQFLHQRWAVELPRRAA